MSEIVIQDYDPEWPGHFERLRAAIWPAVADFATSIEHIGSTSVPGLAAKAVIDLDVVVPPGRVALGIERLGSIGYAHRGDLGVPGREAFRWSPSPASRMGPFGRTAPPRHHLYMCASDSPALANHLTVREYLRTRPEAVREYGELKRSLAARFPHDMDAYVEGKTPFLTAILRQAGFREGALADIERQNAKRS